MMYRHLGLRDWPFRIVPEPEFCDFLADRITLRKEIEQLLHSLESRPTSDIQLLWSWYGAGKTHTLYYLANQCAEKHRTLLPVYTELPRDAKGFFDLYRSTMSQIVVEHVIDVFLEFVTRPRTRPTFGQILDPDLSAALTQGAVGDRPLLVLLGQWLLGNPLPQASLRELGVGTRINSTEKCAVVLSNLVSLLAPRGAPSDQQQGHRRVIWLIDEVQRVEALSSAAHRSVLSGLVGVFNRCPTGLTVVLSYTGAPEEKGLPEWVPEDLRDRIGLERPMLLPPLRSDEAVLLVKELLAHFRAPEMTFTNPFHPFEQEAIETLVRALGRSDGLKPRSIMEALNMSLRHSEPEIQSAAIRTIGIETLKQSLTRMSLDWSEGAQKRHKARGDEFRSRTARRTDQYSARDR